MENKNITTKNNKSGCIALVVIVIFFLFLLNTCSGGFSSSRSDSSDSYSHSYSSRDGLCEYKVNGRYVCNKKATHGYFCQEHYEYLNGIYNDYVG